jgi:hypothetical protein
MEVAMRNTSPLVSALVAVAAGALLAQCQPAPSPTPTPTPCPTASPEERRERWGAIVLYQKAGTCTHLAGPPRIGAYPGESIIWRIYNNCPKEAKVEITDLRLSPSDREGFTYADTWEKINEVKRKRQDKENPHPPLDPFATPEKSKTVAGGGIGDLSLTVRGEAKTGLYTYIVAVNGKPDEGDIDIWP